MIITDELIEEILKDLNFLHYNIVDEVYDKFLDKNDRAPKFDEFMIDLEKFGASVFLLEKVKNFKK